MYVTYYLLYIYSVSPEIIIKGGRVHRWYMMFGQHSTVYKTLFFSVNFKTEGQGSARYHPLGETLIYVCLYM